MRKKTIGIPKEKLIEKIQAIVSKGWIHTSRSKNDGAVGNTLEDLLKIPENNLAISNTLDWELKAQRIETTSLTTLFHIDPYPRKPKTVIQSILKNYGWTHQEAGQKYPKHEMSFRATLCGNYSDRGFRIVVNSLDRKIELEFNSKKVGNRHAEWLRNVEKRIGLGPMPIVPYWDFNLLHKKCVGKIKNTIYVLAQSRMAEKQEEFKYEKIYLLEDFSFNNFIRAIMSNDVLVDFDARTGHNHGTKFRFRNKQWQKLFSKVSLVEG